jgi:DNA-binding CsgD family transcriptional regulator
MIQLSKADLADNQQGQISSAQRRQLQQQRQVYIAGTFGFILLGLTILVVVWLKVTTSTFLNRGQLFIILPIGLFWLWLLRHSIFQWVNVNHDLQTEQVAILTGQVSCHVLSGLGIFSPMKYQIQLNDVTFSVGQALFTQFQNQASYTLYYTPRAHYLLGAIPLVNAQPLRQDSPPVAVPPLLEPLKEREMEILQLIADGYSNKEIAHELSLSVNTVKMYTSQLYQKLDVNRRTEAVVRARQLGLL